MIHVFGNWIYIAPFVTGFLITALATPVCIYIINYLGIVDDPKKHKHPAIIHKKPIPRGGGVPLFIGTFIAACIFLPINSVTISLLIASFIALIIGVLDDKLDVSPYLRFFTNFVVATIVISSGIGINFVTNPLGGIMHLDSIQIPFYFFGTQSYFYLSQLFALVWIVWVMNMLNWSKGVDGQMPGIVAISAFVIGILSLRYPLTDTHSLIAAQLSFILAGSALGFLVFNFYPAKIFPGYGATAIYLLLSVVSILSGAKLATAILVMGVPMIDGVFTILRRILSGKSPFWHDKKHLHHILLKLGYGQRSIALFYWTISAILGAVALMLSSQGKAFAILMLIVVLGGALLFLHFARESDEKN